MNRYVVIDVETTGNKPFEDKIIQVGLVLMEDNNIKETFSSLVYTDTIIPEFIQDLTGISNEMLISAPTIDEVIQQLLPFLENSIFVAHNALFDYEFIQFALEETGYEAFSGFVIDTLQLSKILLPMSQSYKLELITDELNIIHDNPHNAIDDAKATGILFIKLLDILKNMPLIYLQKLAEIFKINNQGLYLIIDQFIDEKINKYQTNDELDYVIHNQVVLRKDIEDKNIKDSEVDYDQFNSIFDENGLLIANFPDFELRLGQKEMSMEIMDAFNESIHLMIEAGTGTGKTLAYLIPAIYWAKEHKEKIVISTHTINLQEQLYHKDIPLLKEIVPFDFSSTILKGRNNYLCLRKFEIKLMQFSNVDLSYDNLVDIAQIYTWLTLTNTGDVEEINLSLSGRNLWNDLRSDADSCLNRLCPWFNLCYYHRVKQKAQMADIIITNHSLLLTNYKTDHRILPSYNRLIIDEAHQFEGVATKHLGYELNQNQFNYFLSKYYKDAKNGLLLNIINDLLSSKNSDQINMSNIIKNEIIPLIVQINDEAQKYFDLISDYINLATKKSDINRRTLRIVDKIIQTSEWKNILLVAENIQINLTEWLNGMGNLSQQMRNVGIDENLYADFSGYIKDLKKIIFIFTELNAAKDPNMVYWIEAVLRGKKLVSYLYAVPIEIGPLIRSSLIDKLDSVIMTSATLSVNDSFNYASKDFGFNPDDQELRKILLPSPFKYEEQVMVYIPNDVPYIKDVSEEKYIEYIAKNIADLTLTMDGRTLVLFTSHTMLQKTYKRLKDILKSDQINVLGHGIDSSSRSKLTKNFKSNSKTVLLGTSSFWEGVDIPGDNLSALVIVRLPFTPPNNPVQEAKEEKLKAEQKNSFIELSLPEAVIRFKQGFGRLIRTQKDRGVVVIFDRRIVESRYGKTFINSLPPVNIRYLSFKDILKDIESWFY